MTLSSFVEATVEAMGGVYLPLEYALCTVLIPKEYVEAFQGRSELLLAFDYEVAQENPNAEFVTYGSYVFDAILQISRTKAYTCQRYAHIERLVLINAAEKIKSHIDFQIGTVEIISENQVVGLWALYNFVVTYTADERFEETQEVFVNLVNGLVDEEIATNAIFYDTKEQFDGMPYIPTVSMEEAYKISNRHVNTIASRKKTLQGGDMSLKKEISRINNYYDELLSENRKRLKRKGVTEERVNDILEKEQALILEKNKQLHEMEEKHILKISISLDNAIVYHIPLIQFICKMSQHRKITEQIFYYDPVMKRIINGEVLSMLH